MARPDKVAAVAELKDEFTSSSGAVLTEYRGLSVAQVTELRRSLGQNARFRIVKNTLTKIAATEAGLDDEILGLFEGPSAIAFVRGDVVETAKGLREFAKANPPLVIKGGVIDGQPMTPDQINQLADLESREVLLAKVAGALKATQSRAAAVFNALPTKTAQLAEALRAKRAESEPAEAESAPAEESPTEG
ncbi:50S ribosomal protein L10 [Allonocardiopsis opalescens]|uniref:Large ribosomal subunit protein uL10 n=1 Tax=Allonocardiopsis opalescens TaxID=1144618 RepID=A0A2T0Q892_9ACTN|nr:50S ribosomal protein L10 [Allonocardiopsis opalescens]PRX99963.1 LSU ribosomal protein L10P [Allonocardiopsis opalescens]